MISGMLKGTVLMVLLAWEVGCGPAVRVSPEAAVAKAQAEAQQSRRQEELLAQANLARVASYRDYRVGPEDLLEITFLGQNELYREVRVNGQGEIDLPLVGLVKVAGLSPVEITQKLAQLYREGKYLKDPQITVVVKEYRYRRVAVSGAVNKPDFYEIIGPRTLLEVLGMAGGLSEKAGDMVHVIRNPREKAEGQVVKVAAVESFTPGYETLVINLNRLVRDGSLAMNIPIQNGDVVYVPFAKNAYVLGAVTKPGSVPVKDNITVSQAVAMAGGTDLYVSSSRVTVVRFNDKGERVNINLNLRNVRNGSEPDPPLKENDVVFVHESPFRRFLFDIKNLNPLGMGMSVMPY
jgi:polysaccharide export outer membrane protein